MIAGNRRFRSALILWRVERIYASDRPQHALEPGPHLGRDLGDLGAVDQLQDCAWVHDLDQRAACGGYAPDDVAREQRPDLRFGLDRPVRELRIAGAEDAVRG